VKRRRSNIHLRSGQAFFLNGETTSNNVATLPGGEAVAIDSVNCGNPYNASSTGTNCNLFVNNDVPTRTKAYDIEFDGFTVPLEGTTARTSLPSGD
jgi:hypothetical protein